MTITKTAVAKVATVATGLAMATSMLSFAQFAHAQSACSVGTVDLTVGSSGAAVTCLQQTLIGAGYAIPAGATGYFGAQTQSAVKAWQAAVGITPASGYFGPISRSHWTGSTAGSGAVSTVPGCTAGAMFSSTTGQACTTTSTVPGCTAGAMFSSTTGQACSTGSSSATGLTGSGRLTNVDSSGSIESDLKEGDAATAVIAVNADAKDGDVAIQRVDVDLAIGTNIANSSSNITKYISSVAVYLDGKKLGEMSASAGDKTSRTWEYRFSGLNGVIMKGHTGEISVKVTPVESVGATEDGETITATIPDDGIRAVGADGISDTYGLSLDAEPFTISTATTGTLTVSSASSNPDDSVVKVDDNTTTTDVTLMTANLKARKQDITVHDFPVQVCTTDVIGDVVQSLQLKSGSTVLKTKSVTGAGACANVVFDNIDQDIAKDSTDAFSVTATLKSTNDQVAYQNGDTVYASTTSALAWDVEDANGDTVSSGNLTGSAQGGTMTLQTTSVTVEKVSATVDSVTNADPATAGSADTKTYKIAFKVTAGDEDVYLDRSVQRTALPSASAAGVAWATTTDSGSYVTGTATTNFTAADTNSGDDANSYKINSGDSRTFTLSVTLTATADGYTAVMLTGINWDTDSSVGTNYYTSNLDTFKTASTFMNFI